jgi:hypothetical protein
MRFLKNKIENEELPWQSRVSAWEAMLGVQNHKRRIQPVVTKVLFPRQLTLSIANPVKLHVYSVKGHIPVMLTSRHRKWALRRNVTLQAGKKCCFACLKTGHLKRKCRAVLKCILREGKHVPVMCAKVEKASEPKAEPVVESSLSNINYSQVFLQSIMVKLRGEQERKVRVLMDPGSQQSYIKRDMTCMEYKPTGEEELGGGGKATSSSSSLL